jgi:general nucleoside transport system permease protein
MTGTFDLGWWGVVLAIIAGAIRVSTPYLLVSLGETLTEKSGRVNLGLEGTLVLGAMSAFATCYLTGSPWLGMLAAGVAGAALGLLHAAICNLPRVNDIAVGIALFIFGIGLAFFLGKPFIEPRAAMLPGLPLGNWSDNPAIRSAFEISPVFFIGIALAVGLEWGLKNTRWGLILRMAGESADAARAIGLSVERIRTLATMAGGSLAGFGGGFLSLYYPGNWNEGLSSGQGLMAIALVIFARWSPLRCFYASLLFGGASAIGPAVQAVGITEGYYLFYAAPYVLTLGLLIYSSSRTRTLAGAPSELSISR